MRASTLEAQIGATWTYPTMEEIVAALGSTYHGKFFLEKIVKGTIPEHDPSLGPCIVWVRALDTHGYGTFKGPDVNGVTRTITAHKWLYMQLNGWEPLPPGYELHHECHDGNTCVPEHHTDCPHRRCVAHVRPVTIAENRQRNNRRQRDRMRAEREAERMARASKKDRLF